MLECVLNVGGVLVAIVDYSIICVHGDITRLKTFRHIVDVDDEKEGPSIDP